MNLLVVFLIILSALMHAFRNFFTKKANDKQIFVWWYEIVAMIFFLPVFLWYIFREGVSNPFYFVIGIAAGLIHFLYWYFLAKSYEKGDLSHVYPIMRADPSFVLLFSVFILKEDISLMGAIGVLTVAFGVYTINLKAFGAKEILTPIKEIFREKHTQFALLTAISVATYSIIDKVGVSYVHPILHIYFITVVAFALFTPYIFKTKNKKLIKNEWVINKKEIIISGIIGILGYSLILIAFTFEKVSYVVGLRQLSIVFAVLLGGHVLKEKHKVLRLIAALFIFAGVYLITIAE